MNAPDSRLNMYIIMFPTMLVQSLTFRITNVRLLEPFLAVRKGFFPVLPARSDLVAVKCDIVDLFKNRPQHWDLQILPKMAHLLVEIAGAFLPQNQRHKPAFSSQMNAIAQALYYSNQHFSESFKIETLATLCNLSTSRFSHLFSEIVGLSPLQYRDELRIASAIERMISTNDTLSHIAHETGFADAIQFSRIIKKVTGQLPTEYRKSLGL